MCNRWLYTHAMISWPAQQPTLTEDEITLRPTRPEDAEAMYAYIANDRDINEFTRVPSPYEKSHSVAAIDQWNADFLEELVLQYAITIDDGPIIGHVSLHSINAFDHMAEIGYIVSADYRGRNIASRSIELLCDYAFAIGFRKISAYVDPRNIASAKAVMKAGFVQEARLRRHFTLRDGSQADALMFSRWDESENGG